MITATAKESDRHSAAHQHFADRDYDQVLRAIQRHFDETVAGGNPIFRTDADGLFDLYLDNLPTASADERQYHNCNTCKRFIETFGTLVTVDDSGDLIPVMWPMGDLGGYYDPAIDALRKRVSSAKIVSAFFSRDEVWGTPETGDWTHFAVRPPREILHRRYDLSPGQAMAANKERRRIVLGGLADFKPKLLDEALRVLKADALARSEKFVAPVQWLRDLHQRPKGRAGDNLLWKAVTLAPEGYCHPRSAVTGSLLEDIAAGMAFADISKRFNAKMHPLQYQRPQAAPSSGTLRQAEQLVEKMGIARSLERRFARLDEVRKTWEPQRDETRQSTGGIFAHLKPKNSTEVPSLTLPAKLMTWEKFVDKVLPTARRMQVMVPGHGNFVGMLTAEHADAPPILKWDREDDRYPISWYLYHGGSPASRWGLRGGSWADVNAIVPKPTVAADVEGGVVLVIDGAKDSRTGQGNALFPETMRAELHPVRSVIEAFSRSAQIGGRDEASANGLGIFKGQIGIVLRVFDGNGLADYRIDRWD